MTTTTAPTPISQPQKLGVMIDKLYDLRDQRRKLDAEVKKLTAQMADLEEQIIIRYDNDEMMHSRGKLASATISENIVPQVEDWDAFYEYIAENEAFYLLQRRATATAFKELHKAGTVIPGVKPITKRTLSLRKA